MGVEPEEVLEEDRVAADPRIEDADDGNQRLRERLEAIDQARREAFEIGRTSALPEQRSPDRREEPGSR